MNKMLQSLLLLTMLNVLHPWQVKAQDPVASTNDFSAILNTNPPDGEDNPKKKKRKNTFVPGCGEVNGFAQIDLQTNAIAVKWQHEGDPSKVQYKLEWKNTKTGAISTKTITPNCTNCVMNETINNLNTATLYEITINALCDISTGSVAQSSVGPKTLLSITTLSQACVAVPYIYPTVSYDNIIAEVPSISTPNTNYIFTLRDATTGAFIASHSQAAVDGTYSFDGLQPCKAYSVDVVAQCPFGQSPVYSIIVKTKCCGEISNIVGSSPAAGSLKVVWSSLSVSNPDNILVEVFNSGTKIDEKILSGSAIACTFDNLAPNFYTVKVTARCQCAANGNCMVTTPFPPVLVNIADPCSIPISLLVQSVKSNEVSFQWTQEPSTKYRKYKLVLYDNNVVVKEKELNAGTLSSQVFIHTFTDIDEKKTYTAKLFTYCCADACCAANPLSSTCSWTTIAANNTVTFTTPEAVCPAAINLNITGLEATNFNVTWQSPDQVNRRYIIQLWKDLFKNRKNLAIKTWLINCI